MTARLWTIVAGTAFLLLASCGPESSNTDNPYTVTGVRCGEPPIPIRQPGNNVTTRVIVEVLEHCGNGAVIEQQDADNQWNDIFGPRIRLDQEVQPRQTGTNIFYGELAGALRVRCVDGTQDSCKVRWKVDQIARSTQQYLIQDTIRVSCADNKPFVAKFNGLRRDQYNATVNVLSDCGNGVRIQRFQHQNAGVTYSGGGTVVVPPAADSAFMVSTGQSAGWIVKSTNNANNVCWFIITCNPGTSTRQCVYTVTVEDPTLQPQ